jgi:hypothetical protein
MNLIPKNYPKKEKNKPARCSLLHYICGFFCVCVTTSAAV